MNDLSGSRLEHQPALDGVRGLAVAGVLLFHGGHFRGGYLGVDAFFVLSGYLITSLLLAEARTRGTVSLRRFWARRARRLLPALGLVLAAVAAYAAFVAKSDELNTIRGDALATIGYVANWRQIWTRGDYFAIFRSPSPLQHTWSLAIEEQFYVLWPLFVIAAVRGRTGADTARRVLVMSLSLAACSILVAQYLYNPSDPARVYYGSDTRASSILIGAALAAWLALRGPVSNRRARAALEVAAVAAVGGLAVAWSHLDGSSSTLYRGGFVACAAAVAIVIAAGVHPEGGVVRRALSVRPLCRLGLVSYGLYLWHWPVYVFLAADRAHLGGWPLLGLRVAVTVAISAASYVFIERPIRYGAGSAAWMRRLTPGFVAVVVIAVVVSTTGAASSSRNAAVDGRQGGVLVIGDSVAHSVFPGLLDSGLHVSQRWAAGCRLLAGEIKAKNLQVSDCHWESAWRRYVGDVRPDVVVLMIGAWDLFDLKPPGSNEFLVPGSRAWNDYFHVQLEKAITILSARGAKLVIPNLPCEGGAVFGDRSSFDVERVRTYNRALAQTLASLPTRVPSPDVFSFLCPAGVYDNSLDSVKTVRSDGIHFTSAGADLFAKWLYPQVLAAAPDRDLLSKARNIVRQDVLVYGDSFVYESRDSLALYLSTQRQWNVVVHAAPFAALCDMVARLGSDLRHYHPTVVVLETSGGSATPCMRTSTGRPLAPGSAAYFEKYRRDFQTFFAVATHAGARVVVVTPPPMRDPAAVADARQLLTSARVEAAPLGRSITFDDRPGNALGGEQWTGTMPCLRFEAGLEGCRDGRIPVRGPDGFMLCPRSYATLKEVIAGCLGYSSGIVRYGEAISRVVLDQEPAPTARNGP